MAVWTLPRQYRVRAALTAFIASALVFFPFFVALASGVPTGAENIPAASGLRGSVTGLLSILQNLFWFQPTYVVETIGPMNWVSLVWTPLWSLLLILTLIGAVAVMAATDHRWRSTFWATLGTLFWVLVAVTLLRDHTPFYMLYVALPPLTMLYALAWTALRRAPSGGVAATGAVSVVVALHLAVCWGYVHMARYGLVASRLPLHSNMQNTATTSHLESTSAAPTRDAVGRWLCGQKAKVALHGDLAATYDIGLGQEQFFHCRDRAIVAAAGGTGNAWTGLPLPVWRQLSVVPTVVLGTYGLVSASTVASPVKSLRQVSGRAYPPRFAQMIAAAGHTDWRVQVQTDGDALLVVSSLMPTYPQFSVTASLAGVAQRPIARFANTFVFRCVHCAALPSNWEIAVRGGAPETTSITALNPAAASASLGP